MVHIVANHVDYTEWVRPLLSRPSAMSSTLRLRPEGSLGPNGKPLRGIDNADAKAAVGVPRIAAAVAAGVVGMKAIHEIIFRKLSRSF